ncbi:MULTISPECIES: dihydrodipicolinate synthase family protein [unclassified Curtobacterium]|uniref:dihydrodipicolinate synthase family protein n=1 Tax=unclassified Curtobacterium TaxID=257496 RepID=UPI003A810B29
MTALTLLAADGSTTSVALAPAPALTRPATPLAAREVFAAAHVVPRTSGDNTPGAPADIDWDQTLAFRHHLWSWGLGVADAMDTAQRNMGLDPAAVRELITRSAAEAATVGGRIAVGVNTDDITDDVATLDRIADAYTAQLQHAEDAGATPVLMASRHLARTATSPDDYRRVYASVLRRASGPVILHWLGDAFDPALTGYFGSSYDVASSTVVQIMEDAADRVSGIKMSLLDADAERDMRRRLPTGVRMFTGDDYHYVDLIAGDDGIYSDALLGAFAALGPLASAAVQALPDEQAYRGMLGPTEPLARHIFATPTWHYKTGVAFLAWLNGHQSAFTMVGGLHAARSLPHLSELVRLANACGALERPEFALERWHALLHLNGVDTAGAPTTFAPQSQLAQVAR